MLLSWVNMSPYPLPWSFNLQSSAQKHNCGVFFPNMWFFWMQSPGEAGMNYLWPVYLWGKSSLVKQELDNFQNVLRWKGARVYTFLPSGSCDLILILFLLLFPSLFIFFSFFLFCFLSPPMKHRPSTNSCKVLLSYAISLQWDYVSHTLCVSIFHSLHIYFLDLPLFLLPCGHLRKNFLAILLTGWGNGINHR